MDERTVGQLLEMVAAKTSAPGGGAVAALTTALAAALGQMVGHFSAGRSDTAEHKELHQEALRTFEQLRKASIDLADADAEAFSRLSELWKLKRDDERRRADWPDAVAAAIEAPRRVMETSLGTLHLLDRLVGTTNTNLRSDLAIAALLAEAACRAAAYNVRVNLPLLQDRAQAGQFEVETANMLQRARHLCETIEQSVTKSLRPQGSAGSKRGSAPALRDG
ncbi:MAG: cyclodeaminase/cyclohydrolase family protein [Phycisphaerales bacterium]|nr:cyclodeaminase/cyclohydrolase family protein [Planctomycetota bacterium]MCZ6734323.1 cyclodeaminase/cyclohydrolase family protein [Planctomycetota bacterium]MCZ6811639.1 cyclodeaminase/cyclohydrolase family protein [Planctomycetota bacterium]